MSSVWVYVTAFCYCRHLNSEVTDCYTRRCQFRTSDQNCNAFKTFLLVLAVTLHLAQKKKISNSGCTSITWTVRSSWLKMSRSSHGNFFLAGDFDPYKASLTNLVFRSIYY